MQEAKRAEEGVRQGGAETEEVGLDLDPASMTVAEVQAELAKRGLDTKWNPLKGKKGLQDRLMVSILTLTPIATLNLHGMLTLQ